MTEVLNYNKKRQTIIVIISFALPLWLAYQLLASNFGWPLSIFLPWSIYAQAWIVLIVAFIASAIGHVALETIARNAKWVPYVTKTLAGVLIGIPLCHLLGHYLFPEYSLTPRTYGITAAIAGGVFLFMTILRKQGLIE